MLKAVSDRLDRIESQLDLMPYRGSVHNVGIYSIVSRLDAIEAAYRASRGKKKGLTFGMVDRHPNRTKNESGIHKGMYLKSAGYQIIQHMQKIFDGDAKKLQIETKHGRDKPEWVDLVTKTHIDTNLISCDG